MATQPVPDGEQLVPEPVTSSAPEPNGSFHDLTGELEITGADVLAEHQRVYASITPEMWAVVERIQLVNNAQNFQPGLSEDKLLSRLCETEAAARRSRRRYELEQGS